MTITDVLPLGKLPPLTYARLARGLSQRELERRAGLPRTVLSQFETGRRRPDAATQYRLAEALGVDVDVLFS
jgi:transcriptional regulator with XRE-family HTH domain